MFQLRRLLPVICIGVVLNLLISWYSTGRGESQVWSRFSIFWLFVAAVLSLLPWFWHGVRLAIWGRFFGVPVSARNLLRIAAATDVGGAVAPQAVGGAPLKIAMLVEQGYTSAQAASLVFLSGVEDLVFFTLAIPVSLFLTHPRDNPLWLQTGQLADQYSQFVWFALLLLAVVYLLYRYGFRAGRKPRNRFLKWQEWAADFGAALRLIYTQGRMPFLLSVSVLCVQWLTRFSVLLTVLLALGFRDHLLHFFLLQWMVFVAMLLTPTPGATGGAEAAFLLVFGQFLPQTAVGLVLAGWRFLTYYFMLLVGVAILWFWQEREAHKKTPSGV